MSPTTTPAVRRAKRIARSSGSDLEGLAERYDSNGDGMLSAADEAFADFHVWQDADGDGTVDAGEMRSLTALGIASISLTSDGTGYSAAGGDVQVVGTGSYTRTDGSTGMLADAVFATGSASQELSRLIMSGNNSVLLAAVAAAGLASLPAFLVALGSSDDEQDEMDMAGTQVVSRTPVESSMGPTGSELNSFATAVEYSPNLVSDRRDDWGISEAETNFSLTGSEFDRLLEVGLLSQNAEARDQSTLAAPALVALPSAEMLANAFAASVQEHVAESEILGLVAESLSVGSLDQAIDAYLDFALPGPLMEVQSFGLVHAGLPQGVEPSLGLAMDHSVLGQIALQHPDAMAPT